MTNGVIDGQNFWRLCFVDRSLIEVYGVKIITLYGVVIY